MKQERNQNRWTYLQNAEIKKTSLKSPLESQRKTPNHIYKKRGNIFLASFFRTFYFLWAISWSVWPNLITNLFRIFLARYI